MKTIQRLKEAADDPRLDDIYRRMAAYYYQVPEELVTSEQRRCAKEMCLKAIYGDPISAHTLQCFFDEIDEINRAHRRMQRATFVKSCWPFALLLGAVVLVLWLLRTL